jgi:UDP-N-acetylmuramoyl-L-alanyl-D-glutamate--2,6-diaminopimelate ligase
MKLKVLLKGIWVSSIKGSKEIEITGVCSNSKYVAPGNLFIVKKGLTEDGRHYISEAISAGAVAILTDIYNPFLKKIVQIIHPEPMSIEGMIASKYYQDPSLELFMVGITGTNGKTTCSYLVKHLFEALGKPCGVIGTIEYIIGAHRYPSTHTTPDAITNQRLLKEMIANGCKAAAMEVSSHALEQGRVSQIDFDTAIFTNLTQDHLDYHLTMDNYASAKGKLFSLLNPKPNKKTHSPKTAIINNDSPWSGFMKKMCKVPIITYGMVEEADLRAIDIQLTKEQTFFKVKYKEQIVPFHWKLIGRYNISNCLAVAALGVSLGIDLEKIAQIMSCFHPAMGRLEKVPNSAGLHIYVDYAHTDDALKNVLECLNEIKTGRIITVFGCGGNRDHGKRPKMAQIAEELSDSVIVTSDNPRDEDPSAICQEIISGFRHQKNYIVEVDRRLAIKMAIDSAHTNDIVLIAGKGHENYQVFSHKTIEFDDRIVAAQLCQNKK